MLYFDKNLRFTIFLFGFQKFISCHKSCENDFGPSPHGSIIIQSRHNPDTHPDTDPDT